MVALSSLEAEYCALMPLRSLLTELSIMQHFDTDFMKTIRELVICAKVLCIRSARGTSKIKVKYQIVRRSVKDGTTEV